jgi:MYXO-CTERM domain-containing protein
MRPALFAGSALAGAVGVAVAAAALPGSGLSPTSVEHGDLGGVLFLVAAFAGFAFYVLGVALIGRCPAVPLRAVCALAVAVQLTPLAGPLLISRDVFAYWDYGDIGAKHDANPYVRAPIRYPHDPAFAAMGPGWRRTPDVYGPAFTLASEGIADASPSRDTVEWTFRITAAAGMLALVALAALRARRRALAAAVVGWNPLLALQSAGGGHNDVWMMAFVLAGLVLAERKRTVLAGVSWALAVFIKSVALGLVPVALIASRRQRGVAIGFAGAATAFAVVATVVFGTSWISALSTLGGRRSRYSIPSRITELGVPHHVAFAVVIVVAAAVFLVLCRSALHGRPRLGAAAVVVLLATPWLLPWYTAWAVPLAAAEEDAAARWLAIALSVYLLPDRVFV